MIIVLSRKKLMMILMMRRRVNIATSWKITRAIETHSSWCVTQQMSDKISLNGKVEDSQKRSMITLANDAPAKMIGKSAMVGFIIIIPVPAAIIAAPAAAVAAPPAPPRPAPAAPPAPPAAPPPAPAAPPVISCGDEKTW